MAVLRAKEAFAYNDSAGVPRVVRPGDLFDASDPAVKKRGHLFETVEVNVERRATVEAATAAPGERRSVSVPRKTRKADDEDDA
jgi:hypothetical protein